MRRKMDVMKTSISALRWFCARPEAHHPQTNHTNTHNKHTTPTCNSIDVKCGTACMTKWTQSREPKTRRNTKRISFICCACHKAKVSQARKNLKTRRIGTQANRGMRVRTRSAMRGGGCAQTCVILHQQPLHWPSSYAHDTSIARNVLPFFALSRLVRLHVTQRTDSMAQNRADARTFYLLRTNKLFLRPPLTSFLRHVYRAYTDEITILYIEPPRPLPPTEQKQKPYDDPPLLSIILHSGISIAP